MDKKPNRLINETSPYLLQHAYNEVDWQSWNDSAFAQAEQEDKIIFLSIGYSTCHWCHVMEKASFENREIGELLNRDYICIKVDRETRPDIDHLYMNYAVNFTGGGGWPLSVFMSFQKKPFFIATYIPPFSAHGRKGMRELLPELVYNWKNNREKLTQSMDAMYSHIVSMDKSDLEEINPEITEIANRLYLKVRDKHYGGFGERNKFPSPQNFLYLLRQFRLTKDEQLLDAVTDGLHAIRLGGIYDHVGFGVHRYATDTRWHLPHFEKMLYDQAMLLLAFADAWSLKPISLFRQTAEEIFRFITRELRQNSGGFYSAYDADSEGEEGRFYVFKIDELHHFLDEDEIQFVTTNFGFCDEGNFDDEATGQVNQTNLFDLGGLPARDSFNPETFYPAWEPIREKIYRYRNNRVKPFLDDKIIFEWNCMVVCGLANAGTVFDDCRMIDEAANTLRFLGNEMISENGEIYRIYREKKAAVSGFLNDYAWYVTANIELYQATMDIDYLSEAFRFQEKIISLFYRPELKKFSITQSDESEKMVKNLFDDFDGAYPSAASVNACNLLRLNRFCQSNNWHEYALDAIRTISKNLNTYPIGYAQWLIVLDILKRPPKQIQIVSDDASEDSQKALRLIRNKNPIDTAVIWKNKTNAAKIERLMPWTKSMRIKPQTTEIYCCENYTCRLPFKRLEELDSFLSEK